MASVPDPCVVVIFGASGDLTSRKLVPALYDMAAVGALPPRTCILGCARSTMTDDAWRDHLEPWVSEHAGRFDRRRWAEFARRIHYLSGDATSPDFHHALASRITELDRSFKTGGNVLFDLAVAPDLYEPIVACLHRCGIVAERRRWGGADGEGAPWQRIIVEKPFGHDLDSAHSLNCALGRVFEEDSIFRIDHYLGKELVQSLLVFRFANIIFEPLWNERYIDHVQITAAETVGAGTRAAFYDRVGAVRDMIQSHLIQVLALVAMEPPTSFAPHHIRHEKNKIIDAIMPIPADRLGRHAVLGQYAGDGDEPAYHESPGVSADSTTETYAAVVFRFDNWRWAGTPFYVRTGKRLAAKRTEIVIQFRQPPAHLFRAVDGDERRPANRIVIQIAPGGSVSLRFEGKVPGTGMKRDTVAMDFDYARRFGAEPVEAYGPLLLDAMRGDQSLFQHRFEVEGAWRAVMPLLGPESAGIRRAIRANYAPGSWGPPAADRLLASHGRAWVNDQAVLDARTPVEAAR